MMKSSQSHEEELGRASPVLWPFRRYREVEQVDVLEVFFYQVYSQILVIN